MAIVHVTDKFAEGAPVPSAESSVLKSESNTPFYLSWKCFFVHSSVVINVLELYAATKEVNPTRISSRWGPMRSPCERASGSALGAVKSPSALKSPSAGHKPVNEASRTGEKVT